APRFSGPWAITERRRDESLGWLAPAHHPHLGVSRELPFLRGHGVPDLLALLRAAGKRIDRRDRPARVHLRLVMHWDDDTRPQSGNDIMSLLGIDRVM